MGTLLAIVLVVLAAYSRRKIFSATAQPVRLGPGETAIAEVLAKTDGLKHHKKPLKGASAKEADAPRPESKSAKILALISRAKGATLGEIMQATDWQAHSVRGFLSAAGKKHQLTIESTKNEAGDRLYKISN